MSLTPVQTSTAGAFNGSLTATTTLTGVTAGNTIIAIVMHGDRSGSAPALPVSDAQGTYTADVTPSTVGGVAKTVVARLANANAGTHTISVTASSGTAAQSNGWIVALEVPPALFDTSNTGGTTGTAASVAATGALAGSGELAVAGIYFDNMSTGGGTFPPTGGPGTYTEIAAHGANQAEAAYQVLSTAAGVGANWGTFTTSSKWSAVVAVYKAVSAPNVGSVVPAPGNPALSSPRNNLQFQGVGRVMSPPPIIAAAITGFSISMSVAYGPSLAPSSSGFVPQPGPGPAGPFNNNQFLSKIGDVSAPSASVGAIFGIAVSTSVPYGAVLAAGNLSGIASSHSVAFGPGFTLFTGPISGLTVSQSVAYGVITGTVSLVGGLSVSMSLAYGSLGVEPIFPHTASGGQNLTPPFNLFAKGGRGGDRWGAFGGGDVPIGGGVTGQDGWDNPIAETISTDQRQANYIVNGKPVAGHESDTTLPTTTPDDSLPPGGDNAG